MKSEGGFQGLTITELRLAEAVQNGATISNGTEPVEEAAAR